MKIFKHTDRKVNGEVHSPWSIVHGKNHRPWSIVRGKKAQTGNGLWTTVCGLAFLLLFTQNAFSQPTVSYPSPRTYAVGSVIAPLSPTVTGGPTYANGQTTTLAGSTTAGYVDATGTSARFNGPGGIAIDAMGNVYIGDAANNRIRKITPGGVVTTFAGSGTAGNSNGTGTAATFSAPYELAIDAQGNIYVADKNNNLVRKITPGAVVTTFAGSGAAGYADGTGTAAIFNSPSGLAIDAQGNLYVGDTNNNRIRKISPLGVVTTLAGSGTAGAANGTGTSAQFNQPFGVAVDAQGNVYVADYNNHIIRAITPGAVVTTFSGNGTPGWNDGGPTVAEFYNPAGLAIDASGILYVADKHNNRIRAVSGGYANTLAGTGTAGAANGNGGSATFNNPLAVAIDSTGFLYVADFGNNMIRKVDYGLFTIAPTLPQGLSFSPATGIISGVPLATSAATNYTITIYTNEFTPTATVNITVTAAPAGGQGQSLNENYVLTNAPRVAGITNDSTLTTVYGLAPELQTSIQYVDGLGRPIQTVQKQASPNGHDMVVPQAYDPYGREVYKFLPYTPQSGTAGSFRPNAASTDQAAFYASPPTGINIITSPFSQTNFDNSPLNRPVEQGAPGTDWQITGTGDHTVKMVYLVNDSTSFAADSINGKLAARYYTVINSNFSQTLHANGYYPAGTLTVAVMKDENWQSGRAGTVEEYKDIDGHVVLKRQYNYVNSAVQMLSTYYVYDDLGRLAFVLPPTTGADGAITFTTALLNNLCYMYQYDERGRPIQKRLPGKGWEYAVYNTMDQPVATQDSLQRNANQWIFTKYDGQQRAIMSGIWNNGGSAISRASLKTILDGITSNLYETAQSTGNGYTNVAWPTTNMTTTLDISYYDSYANMPGLPAAYSAPTGANLATRGELTGSLTNVLGTGNMLWKVSYYDYWGHSLEGYAQHYLGGTLSNNNYDAVSTTYNFTNAPTTVTRKHWNTTSTTYPLVTVYNRYLYDQVGRKLNSWEQIRNANNTPDTLRLISNLVYNEIGQVYKKNLHSRDSVTYLQTVGYSYNERGWLLTANAPLFAVNLYYNTSTNRAYNGNIMYQYFGVPGNLNNHYIYLYDKLNRLLSGVTTLDSYKENGITYDQEGNITALNRYQQGTQIDQLSYNYTLGGNASNQLQSVVDANASNSGLVSGTTNYTYDGNGNMLTATNAVNNQQNKSFTYNLLNLPLVATISAGTATYSYDASGGKLRKVDVLGGVTTTTDYIGGIQYNGTSTTDTLSFIQTEEGKAVHNGTTYDYQYYLADNLGNTRVTFNTKKGVAYNVQQDDYYPFGLEINRSLAIPTKNEYLYNKKELQEEFTEYDYGARFYDPVVVHWNTIDPLAEISTRESPYTYVSNNPIRFIDPDGMSEEDDLLKDKSLEKQSDINVSYTRAASGATNGADVSNGDDNNESNPGNDTATADPSTSATNSGTAGGVLNSTDDGGKKDTKKAKAETGSYTITFKNGKKYHGKGSRERAKQSAKRIADLEKTTFDEKDIDWTPAPNDREAFKDEDKRMNSDPLGNKDDANYNKNKSPGAKYNDQDQVPQMPIAGPPAGGISPVAVGSGIGVVIIAIITHFWWVPLL